MNTVVASSGWKRSKADNFWGKLAPFDHVVQIYEHDDILLEALAGFVGDGINAGDCCIVIATQSHLRNLEDRLTRHGVHVNDLVSEKRYFPLDAEETLDSFMIDGYPNEDLFNQTISGITSTCTEDNRKIRAFGEMVALLYARGNKEATIELEQLWNKFCERQSLCLFCAYPKSDFKGDTQGSVDHICSTHTKMISGTHNQINEVTYRDIVNY